MGKVRQDRVKRIAKSLLDRFPDRFNDDFNSNKNLVEALTDVSSKKLRNMIAGYITHLISITQSSKEKG